MGGAVRRTPLGVGLHACPSSLAPPSKHLCPQVVNSCFPCLACSFFYSINSPFWTPLPSNSEGQKMLAGAVEGTGQE